MKKFEKKQWEGRRENQESVISVSKKDVIRCNKCHRNAWLDEGQVSPDSCP